MAHDTDDDLTGYAEHVRDSQNLGDARRCPRHPHVKTSSDDGLHDGLCGECEAAMDEEGDLARYVAELSDEGRAALVSAQPDPLRGAFEARGLDYDPDGPRVARCPYCDTPTQYATDHDCAGLRAESGEAAHDAAADGWPDLDF